MNKRFFASLVCLLAFLCLTTTALAARPSYGGGNQSYDINDPNEQEDNISYVNTTSFGRGGFGQVSRPKTHARSTTDSLLPYDALEMTISPDAAPVLIFGGTEPPLTLESGGSFTAQLGVWDGNQFLVQREDATVLCLSAGSDEAWLFPGSVLKTLRSSGIDWLLLQSGDTQTLLPTASFLSGSCYDSWRRAGLTDGTFRYRLQLSGGSLQMELTAGDETVKAEETGGALAYTGITTTIVRGEP